MHSTALMYLPGAAILNTLCSDDVTYPDHVVPLQWENGQLEYERATSRYHGTLPSILSILQLVSFELYSNNTEHGSS